VQRIHLTLHSEATATSLATFTTSWSALMNSVRSVLMFVIVCVCGAMYSPKANALYDVGGGVYCEAFDACADGYCTVMFGNCYAWGGGGSTPSGGPPSGGIDGSGWMPVGDDIPTIPVPLGNGMIVKVHQIVNMSCPMRWIARPKTWSSGNLPMQQT
jgi:hypothetical protein